MESVKPNKDWKEYHHYEGTYFDYFCDADEIVAVKNCNNGKIKDR